MLSYTNISIQKTFLSIFHHMEGKYIHIDILKRLTKSITYMKDIQKIFQRVTLSIKGNFAPSFYLSKTFLQFTLSIKDNFAPSFCLSKTLLAKVKCVARSVVTFSLPITCGEGGARLIFVNFHTF